MIYASSGTIFPTLNQFFIGIISFCSGNHFFFPIFHGLGTSSFHPIIPRMPVSTPPPIGDTCTFGLPVPLFFHRHNVSPSSVRLESSLLPAAFSKREFGNAITIRLLPPLFSNLLTLNVFFPLWVLNPFLQKDEPVSRCTPCLSCEIMF